MKNRDHPPILTLRDNLAAWFRYNQGVTVTNAGVSQWNDQSGNARHLKQATDANRPFYATANALRLPGVAGAYASTPDSAAASITGDIDIQVRVALVDWTPAANQHLVTKYTEAGNKRSYMFRVTTAGKLEAYTSNDGTADVLAGLSTVAVSATDGETLWVRWTLDVDDGAGNRVCKFYTAADSTSPPTSWTQLGATVTTAATTSINDNDAALLVGAIASGFETSGAIYRAQIYDGIDGTLAVDFNPSDTTDGDTSFASSTTGETWTINGTAYLYGVPGSILFDGVDNYLKCDAFTLNQPETVYVLFKQVTWEAEDRIFDGNTGDTMDFAQKTATPSLGIYAGTGWVAENGDLAVDTYGVAAVVFNGASSLIQINNGTATTGNPGASNAGGFTLGAGAIPSNYSNIQVKEVIIYSAAHDATQRAHVINYLRTVGKLL